MRAHETLAAADAAVQQWSLRRNCALTPRQLLGGLGVAPLVRLSAAGRSVQIGAHVPGPLRPRLAAELRSALQTARAR